MTHFTCPIDKGVLVRYAGGSTALGIVAGYHAGGYVLNHCMGGAHFVTHESLCIPSLEDYKTWVECGKWRRE